MAEKKPEKRMEERFLKGNFLHPQHAMMMSRHELKESLQTVGISLDCAEPLSREGEQYRALVTFGMEWVWHRNLEPFKVLLDPKYGLHEKLPPHSHGLFFEVEKYRELVGHLSEKEGGRYFKRGTPDVEKDKGKYKD